MQTNPNRKTGLRMLGVIALLAAIAVFCLPAGSAHAASSAQMRPTTCHFDDGQWTLSNVTILTGGGNLDCWWPFSSYYIYARSCSGGAFTINMDAWQTHATIPGAQRFGETGRTGWNTYPPDCQLHGGTTSNVWWGLSDPDWGCGWAQLYNGPSQDFMCVYIQPQ